MHPMRRAVLAILLCVAPLSAASAHASSTLLQGEQLRAAGGNHAVVPLPLPADLPAAPASLASIARDGGSVHVLVGVRDHADLPGVQSALEGLGAHPEAFASVGVLSATVPDGTALAAALGNDPRVAYIEREGRVRIAADPLDAVDPATGLKFTWGYD